MIFQAKDYDGIIKLFRKAMKNKQNFTDLDSEYYKYVFAKKRKFKISLILKIFIGKSNFMNLLW